MDLPAELGQQVAILDVLISLGIGGLGILVAVAVYYLMKGLADITRRSRFRFDGIIVRVTARPIAILIGTLSFLYALRRIQPIYRYMEQWPTLDIAIVVIIAAWMLGTLVRELINVYFQPLAEATDTEFDNRLLYLLDLTVTYIVYVVGFALALHTLGVEITALIASLGIAGLAVALAAKTILSNFFGGIMLTLDKYIDPGDRIRVGDWIGDVEDITLYKTTIRTRDNLLVSIPNDVLMQETTINYQLPESLTRVELDIGVAYGSDLDRATEIILDIIENCNLISDEREPEVNVTELGDHGINLNVLYWQFDPTGQRTSRDYVYREVLRRFREREIEIPYPHLDVALREPVRVDRT